MSIDKMAILSVSWFCHLADGHHIFHVLGVESKDDSIRIAVAPGGLSIHLQELFY